MYHPHDLDCRHKIVSSNNFSKISENIVVNNLKVVKVDNITYLFTKVLYKTYSITNYIYLQYHDDCIYVSERLLLICFLRKSYCHNLVYIINIYLYHELRSNYSIYDLIYMYMIKDLQNSWKNLICDKDNMNGEPNFKSFNSSQ